MIEVEVYLFLLTGASIIFGWWIFNHFDDLFNAQLKVHDDIINKVLSINERIKNLENTEDIKKEEPIEEIKCQK